MNLPKRFTIATLLLAMLVTSLVFGYAQWRRQWLIKEIHRLETEGVEISGLGDNWFWPRVDGEAFITLVSEGRTSYSYHGIPLTLQQAKERFYRLTSQLRDIGVTDIWYCVTRDDDRGGGYATFNDLDSLELQTRSIY
ncbi:hypothetical protein [Lacipirellula limnantheis]|uniref:Uncharacterized protein n=1 Tax=Lacipirellula limnantheis TaxID=2528024 RepID=A0A517U1I4_9BACT|nr:hypothetical protein [Lacipirellula limnantheis]QDT74477.1 hypothetical protein I41_36740 [Lacipirellula limnantheis]